MAQQIVNLNSLLCGERESVVTRLRQCSPSDLQKFLNDALDRVTRSIECAASEDIIFVDIITTLVTDDTKLFGLKCSCAILIECSFFYEQLGNFKEGTRIGLIASRLATKHGDINLLRRANNVLGALSIRTCDFKAACYYFEAALRMAQRLSNPLYECSVLGNVAGLFNAMGLNRDATSVYLRCLSYKGNNTSQFRTMQAYNAVNALKISPLVSDGLAADYSYKIACKHLRLKQFSENELLLAYFEFGRARYLIDRGKQFLAARYIKKAIARHRWSSNPRVHALLKTAEALYLFASGHQVEIQRAKCGLKRLLATTKAYPTHHEDVLRALIQVYSAENTFHGIRTSLKYAQRLRQYVMEEKRIRFSVQVSGDFGDNLGPVGLGSSDGPGETIFAPMPYSRFRTAPLGSGTELDGIYDDLARVGESLSEERFITGAYSVAENWALAAEFSSDSSGRHCFRVGKLAGALAFVVGMGLEKCIELELACRLHDIGKIAISEGDFSRFRGGEMVGGMPVNEHAIAGAQLLECSTEPILRKAAVIARSHHEWWNGCGYPDGLRGEAIPIEARICAIADTYDSFINPVDGRGGWTHKEAVRQICAMGGVQLDPGLISPFLEAVGADAAESDRVAEEVERSMERNQLARAKKKLFETLELVD